MKPIFVEIHLKIWLFHLMKPNMLKPMKPLSFSLFFHILGCQEPQARRGWIARGLKPTPRPAPWMPWARPEDRDAAGVCREARAAKKGN